MNEIPNCPKCGSEYCYEDGALFVCPDCSHEWSQDAVVESVAEDESVTKDAVGNALQDGDTVTVVKDLPVKGASGPLKAGTKVKNIRLVEGDHDISCKIPGFGSMGLKSQFVKKA